MNLFTWMISIERAEAILQKSGIFLAIKAPFDKQQTKDDGARLLILPPVPR